MGGVDRRPTTLAGRYELVRVVGRGGMGEVWAGRDLRLGRAVAVKLLSPQLASELGVRERFEAEGRAAAGISHPNVVAVYDTGEDDGVAFLVMELLPGPTLADEIGTGPLDTERARSVGAQVVAAVDASHRTGILHRDIKPGNILITNAGAVKVGDFGIAKSTEGAHLTSTGMIVGTAAYLAPERLAGNPATAQSDLYAVGVVLYEALTGSKPFQGDTPLAMLRAVDAHRPIPLSQARPGIDAALAGVVERAMAKDPADRFPTAGAMLEAFRSHNPTGPITVALPSTPTVAAPAAPQTASVQSPPSAAPQLRRWAGVRARTATIAVLAVVALLVVIVALSTRRGPGSPAQSPTQTSPAPAAAPRSLPPGLAEALTRLEDAVRP